MDQAGIKVLAWVWLALIVAGGGKPVKQAEIIEAGDYINHAVLNMSEIKNSLSRLIELNLIQKTANGHGLSAHGQAVYAKLSRKNKDFYVLMGLIEQYLQNLIFENAENKSRSE